MDSLKFFHQKIDLWMMLFPFLCLCEHLNEGNIYVVVLLTLLALQISSTSSSVLVCVTLCVSGFSFFTLRPHRVKTGECVSDEPVLITGSSPG